MTLQALTLSIPIDRPWRDVYEAIWRPQDFPRWASGLSASGLEQVGDGWRAEGPDGPVILRFTPHNAFGVMDHSVDLGQLGLVHVPMRVVANQDGAEVMLTLFRQPWMNDETFASDVDWIRRDLQALKDLLTQT